MSSGLLLLHRKANKQNHPTTEAPMASASFSVSPVSGTRCPWGLAAGDSRGSHARYLGSWGQKECEKACAPSSVHRCSSSGRQRHARQTQQPSRSPSTDIGLVYSTSGASFKRMVGRTCPVLCLRTVNAMGSHIVVSSRTGMQGQHQKSKDEAIWAGKSDSDGGESDHPAGNCICRRSCGPPSLPYV